MQNVGRSFPDMTSRAGRYSGWPLYRYLRTVR